MRWLIATFMAIVTLAPLGAGAADLPPAPPGPAVYAPPAAYRAVANWGGFYVGGNVGINFARDRSTFSVGGMPFSTVDTAVFGAAGGAQVGYNWQSGALVLGAEADFDWTNAKGSISAQCGICGPVTNATIEHDVEWFGTARARIGYAADGWLAYATGGYAFGRVALKGTATGGGVNASLTQNATPRLDHRAGRRSCARAELERKARISLRGSGHGQQYDCGHRRALVDRQRPHPDERGARRRELSVLE